MITIEKFKEKDVDYILRWFTNQNNRKYQKTKTIDRQGALELIRSSDKRKVYCVRLNNEPIGYAMLKNLPKNPEVGITIDEAFWGKGYGTETMRLLEAKAIRFGAKKISLLVDRDNKRAIKFYRKLDYHDTGLIMMEKKF